MAREAWFCPSCQKHHAPHVDTCPQPQVLAVPTPSWPPHVERFYPEYLKRTDPCANCKGACGNAACPKLMKITLGLGGALQ